VNVNGLTRDDDSLRNMVNNMVKLIPRQKPRAFSFSFQILIRRTLGIIIIGSAHHQNHHSLDSFVTSMMIW